MHPFTTKRLLHLISIPFFPSSTSALLPVFPSQPLECQYPSPTYGTYIYFTSPNDTNFAFAIHTAWKQYYPTALRAALVLADFRLADAPREHDRQALCEWQALDSVSIQGWPRGDLIAKDLLSRNPLVSSPSTQESGRANPSPLLAHPKQRDMRLPSTPTAPYPDPETLSRVHQILLTNVPGADIALFLLELASTIFWAVTLALILVYIILRASRHAALRRIRTQELRVQQQRQGDGEDLNGDIELATLRRVENGTWKVPLGIRKLSFPKPCLGAAKGGRGGLGLGRETSLDGATLRGA